MRVHLVNPRDTSFGIGVITPRWSYKLEAATPAKYGDSLLADATLEQTQPKLILGDIAGIDILTGNALRSMQVERIARERKAWVASGGIHSTLSPEQSVSVQTCELGGAQVAVKGDGVVVWGRLIPASARGAAPRWLSVLGRRLFGGKPIPELASVLGRSFAVDSITYRGAASGPWRFA